MTEKEIQAALASYSEKFERLGLTMFGMSDDEREAAAVAAAAAVKRGRPFTRKEIAALEPERPDGVHF